MIWVCKTFSKRCTLKLKNLQQVGMACLIVQNQVWIASPVSSRRDVKLRNKHVRAKKKVSQRVLKKISLLTKWRQKRPKKKIQRPSRPQSNKPNKKSMNQKIRQKQPKNQKQQGMLLPKIKWKMVKKESKRRRKWRVRGSNKTPCLTSMRKGRKSSTNRLKKSTLKLPRDSIILLKCGQRHFLTLTRKWETRGQGGRNWQSSRGRKTKNWLKCHLRK